MATIKRKRTEQERRALIAGLLDEDERLAVGLALAHWLERGTDGRRALRKVKALVAALAAV